MRDSLEFETAPSDEPCAQVGSEGYSVFARLEAKALYQQILRMFGNPPEGLAIRLASAPHDFGSYYELKFSFDDENEAAVNYAFKVEESFPDKWDSQARDFLLANDYTLLSSDSSHLSSFKQASDEINPQEGGDQSFLVSKTFERVTEESAQNGDAEERGFVFEDEIMDFDDVVRELRTQGYYDPSSSHLSGLRWVSTEPEQDFSDGSYTIYSLHVEDMYGRDISSSTWFSLLKASGLSNIIHE